MRDQSVWHITEMALWERDSLNREAQAFIRLQADGSSKFQGGLVSGAIDGEVVVDTAGEGFECTWEAHDECEPASGGGWLEMTAKNELAGKIKIHPGDHSTLTAKRAK